MKKGFQWAYGTGASGWVRYPPGTSEKLAKFKAKEVE